jgi:hypothetical protein
MSSYTDTTLLVGTGYIKTGVGGAGNFISRATLTPSIPMAIPARSTSNLFHSGIGGAGNRQQTQDRAYLTLVEDMDRTALRRGSAATSWHHGIGGAGNRAGSDDGSYASSSLSSSSSWKSTGKLSGADRLKQKIIGKWTA